MWKGGKLPGKNLSPIKEIAQKTVSNAQKNGGAFVDNAMIYGDLDKKIDVFYEK